MTWQEFEDLLHKYGWRACILLMASVLLLACGLVVAVFALLIRIAIYGV